MYCIGSSANYGGIISFRTTGSIRALHWRWVHFDLTDGWGGGLSVSFHYTGSSVNYGGFITFFSYFEKYHCSALASTSSLNTGPLTRCSMRTRSAAPPVPVALWRSPTDTSQLVQEWGKEGAEEDHDDEKVDDCDSKEADSRFAALREAQTADPFTGALLEFVSARESSTQNLHPRWARMSSA